MQLKPNNTLFSTYWIVFLLIIVSSVIAFNVHAQDDYPNRTVKIIYPFGPVGGVPEQVLRIFTNDLSSRFGQSFVIEHRPGASTNIAAAIAARARPDGYTLFMSNVASNALNKWTYKKLDYDPESFATISIMATTTFLIVVNPDSAINNIQDLVTSANKSTVSFKYGSLGNGGAAHLLTELFKTKTGIKELLHVPYKSGATTDLMAGRLDFIIDASVINQVKTGQLKALAVTSPKRWPTLPDLPTTAEAGYPDVTMLAFIGLSAPSGTPPVILEKLNQAIREIAANPDNVKRMLSIHAQPMITTRIQAADFIRETSDKWRPVIKSLNLNFED